jgi:hypothetical protein
MFDSGMCVGEKVETIIFSRRSGKFGDYLGSSVQTFGAARVDDIIFKVERNNNVGCAWFWKVRNVETGLVSTAKDRNDLYLAVREVA